MKKYVSIIASFVFICFCSLHAQLDQQLSQLTRSLHHLEDTLKVAVPEPAVELPPKGPITNEQAMIVIREGQGRGELREKLTPADILEYLQKEGYTFADIPTPQPTPSGLPDLRGKSLDEAVGIAEGMGITYPNVSAAQEAFEFAGFDFTSYNPIQRSIALNKLVKKKPKPKPTPVPSKGLQGTFKEQVQQAEDFARQAIKDDKVSKEFRALKRYLQKNKMYPKTIRIGEEQEIGTMLRRIVRES